MGAAFGGYVLGLMDKVGSYAAARHARNVVVTVAVSQVEFKVPIRSGDLLEIIASLREVGRTSITVAVEVYKERFGGGEKTRTLATSGSLVYVAIDDQGRATPVPPLS